MDYGLRFWHELWTAWLSDESYASAELPERLAAAESALHPLQMTAISMDGVTSEALAINEVSLIRQTHNAAHIGITVDDKRQLNSWSVMVCCWRHRPVQPPIICRRMGQSFPLVPG